MMEYGYEVHCRHSIPGLNALQHNQQEPGVEGVLLYYAYRDLTQTRDAARNWFQELCTKQGLVGRVRVAFDGLNATLGGSMHALREHVQAVEARFGAGGEPIDFKLAESSGPRSAATMHQSGFDRLSVQACKEVVSLCLPDFQPAAGAASLALPPGARHVDPQEFHAMLAEAQARHTSSGSHGACSNGAGGSYEAGEADSQGGSEDGCSSGSGSGGGKETVLIDTRNFYETQVGRFEVPGVEVLDPEVRCFSDTPAWLEANQHRLANRRIMMYCTGGVRCERASAYLMSLGSCFQDVVQLRGGIQRYLEAYPADGGFFRGANFVFDERGGVEGGSKAVVGACVACGAPWGDYSRRRRCSTCRMLVLVCNACAGEAAAEEQDCSIASQEQDCCTTNTGQDERGAAVSTTPGQQLTCALCAKRQQRATAGAASNSGGRRLRILCLHGFRQTARNFEGRTHGLRKRLRHVADFVFVDAPHLLPAWTKKGTALDGGGGGGEGEGEGEGEDVAVEGEGFEGQIEQQQDEQQQPEQQQQQGGQRQRQQQQQQGGQRQRQQQQRQQQQRQGKACSGPHPDAPGCLCRSSMQHLSSNNSNSNHHNNGSKKQEEIEGQEGEQKQWQHQQHQDEQQKIEGQRQQEGEGLQPQNAVNGTSGIGSSSQASAAAYVDEWQFKAQTAGWEESDRLLQQVLEEQGPWDGVLGFSQGASVAGFLAARQWLEQKQAGQLKQGHRQGQQGERQQQQRQGDDAGRGHEASTDGRRPLLRFAILCSGYRSPLPTHQQVLEAAAAAGGASLPTLHIYGTGGQDRQIGAQDSAELADCFDPTQRFIVRHGGGHVIPASKAVAVRLLDFLAHVQQQGGDLLADEPQAQAAAVGVDDGAAGLKKAGVAGAEL